MRLQDLTGQKFGRLTVIERSENKGKRVCWRCRCECGKEVAVAGEDLRERGDRACGCFSRQFKDLTGMKFGKLTALETAGISKNGTHLWKCACDCGNFSVVSATSLIKGNTRSCGCLNKEASRAVGYKNRKHGLSSDKIHEIWDGIKKRCYNPNCKSYKDYGGRGITVCEEWKNSFQAFYEYVSKLEHYGEEGYSLDRIDNNGNYEPSNVRWADRKTQSRNRRNVTFVEYQGAQMTLAEASEKSNVNADTLRFRMKRGETGEYLFRLPK